jgi:hypothetical protein
MPNVFAKLPNEILNLILNHLDQKHDWLMLTLSCRLLYTRINPKLYEFIETPCYCVGIHKTLVYTFLGHPELSCSVRGLKIGRLPYGANPKAYSNHQHDHHDRLNSKQGLFHVFGIHGPKTWKRRLNDVIEILADRNWERTQWMEDLQSGTHRDPWLAILLYLLPNLETIELFWGGTGTRYSSWVLSRIPQRYAPFDHRAHWANLHAAIIKIPEDEGADTNIHRIMPFFVIPSMRTFRGQLLTDKYLEPTLNIKTSPITHLEFIQCSSVLGFNYLIKLCPNLQSFKYTQQEDDCIHRSPGYNNIYFDTLRPTAFKDILSTKRNTLQSVTVDVSRRCSDYGGFYSDDWIGCMADFSQLRYLQIRASNFIGRGRGARLDVDPEPRVALVEFLPASIEELWISGIEKRAMGTIMRELVGLVSVSRERFVGLRKIDVEGRKWLEEKMEGEEQTWRKMYPDYGVLLQEGVLVATEEVRRVCLETGVEFHVRDTSVEATFEEYDDVFLFARDEEEDD